MTNHIEELAVNTIRTLSIDSIEKANSGHPGMPMGAAPMALNLWTKHMNHNPANPNWSNRDRFVLSAGHGSMLLYSLLHLTGYDVTLDDLKSFRQLGSRTPGHPEYRHTDGVEATTGPLGQGIAMAVGMAMAERHLADTYNTDKHEVVDHFTYAICGDGDLMEGVSAEAASLAGHLKLNRLVVLYDSNDISLDGDLHESFSESVEDRFKAYGWNVIYVTDGMDMTAIHKALEEAKTSDKPTLIEVKTVIGFGSPNKSAKSASHGAPLGSDEVALTKDAYKWTYEEEFHVPEEVAAFFADVKEAGTKKEQEWNELFAAYKAENPELAAQYERAFAGELPEDFDQALPVYEAGKSLATRASSGEALNALAKHVPELFGGSADLAGSNKTTLNGESNFSQTNYGGRNIWFGVREFAMGCALNGMALHGGLKVFGGTFFVFSDYLRPAIRLSALMGVPVTYVLTHDSVAVGEDGPTHEPVEQLAALRAMPGLSIIRPGDGNETAAAWKLALESTDKPTALVLSRQNVETQVGTDTKAYEGVKKGAYIVSEAKDKPEVVLLATGSEVPLAVQAQTQLAKDGIDASVVSMPSWDRFDAQPKEYKDAVIPKDVKARLAIEMGASLGWAKYVGDEGDTLTIDTFGASGAGDEVIASFGFTVENVVNRAKALLK
ncbi:transketolase [Alkalihalobacillus xiaoxiensis]|uniref:Transketolase n=1 Tax=Shouchella xiaoxiensis TaxID=766895 RepID=A0ABS2SQH1_9BACI|nr:transketolase [Shouchella xiaoxiensis]MBM7837756.1 transketolase [Shouchella xiaoxiensis]